MFQYPLTSATVIVIKNSKHLTIKSGQRDETRISYRHTFSSLANKQSKIAVFPFPTSKNEYHNSCSISIYYFPVRSLLQLRKKVKIAAVPKIETQSGEALKHS